MSDSTCLRCNGVGHFARECTQKPRCDFCGQQGHLQKYCTMKRATAVCSRCNSQGHYARDCRAKGGEPCFRCGQVGHMARECPKAGESGDACHVCGEQGHFARECTKGPQQGARRLLESRTRESTMFYEMRSRQKAFDNGYLMGQLIGGTAPPAPDGEPPPLYNPSANAVSNWGEAKPKPNKPKPGPTPQSRVVRLKVVPKGEKSKSEKEDKLGPIEDKPAPIEDKSAPISVLAAAPAEESQEGSEGSGGGLAALAGYGSESDEEEETAAGSEDKLTIEAAPLVEEEPAPVVAKRAMRGTKRSAAVVPRSMLQRASKRKG